MKFRHAVALALVGWYLMTPPRISNWPLSYDTDAPISRWMTLGSFDTAEQCDARKTSMEYLLVQKDHPEKGEGQQSVEAFMISAKCVSTDDPRLKEK